MFDLEYYGVKYKQTEACKKYKKNGYESMFTMFCLYCKKMYVHNSKNGLCTCYACHGPLVPSTMCYECGGNCVNKKY